MGTTAMGRQPMGTKAMDKRTGTMEWSTVAERLARRSW